MVGPEGYCVKERKKVPIKDPEQVKMNNGQPAIQGTCPDCGTKIFKIGALSDVSDREPPEIEPLSPQSPEERKSGEAELHPGEGFYSEQAESVTFPGDDDDHEIDGAPEYARDRGQAVMTQVVWNATAPVERLFGDKGLPQEGAISVSVMRSQMERWRAVMYPHSDRVFLEAFNESGTVCRYDAETLLSFLTTITRNPHYVTENPDDE